MPKSKKTTDKDIRGMKTYEELYDMGFSAVGKLDARANETEDVKQENKLRAKANEIMAFMFELRNAELVVLRTPTDEVSAGQQLRKAVQTAHTELRKLEHLSTALQAATTLLNLARNLVRLVAAA